MIKVPSNVLDSVNADCRHFEIKVNMYINGDNEEPLVLSGDNIISLDILEESSNSIDKPIGNLASNELSLSIYNENNKFTITNTTSEYADKIKPGMRLEVFACIELENDNYYDIPMGVFFMEDWRSNSNTISCDIVAYDRLFSLLDKDMPSIPIIINGSVRELLMNIFDAIGIHDYEIDNTLGDIVKFGYIPNGTISSVLKSICESYGVLITVNRYNKVIVKKQTNLTESEITLSGENQILELTNIPSHSNVYSQVSIDYNIGGTSNVSTEVLKLENLEVKPGSNIYENLKLKEGPVLYISAIEVRNGLNIKIIDYNINTYTMSLELYNSGNTTELVNVTLNAVCLDISNATLLTTNDDFDITKREMKVKCELIRDVSYLQEYSNFLLKLGSNVAPLVELIVRGNPTIELTDIIDVQTNAYNFNGKIIPIQLQYDFSNGLECRILGVNAETRDFMNYSFVGMNMLSY